MRARRMIRLPVRLRPERGFTLAEVMVTMMIMGLAVAVFLSVLASVQRGVVYEDNLSRANDSARLGVEELDREIRSGNVLYNPADEGDYSALPVGFTLRIYTQANATSRTPEPGYVCVLWSINDDNELVRNIWPPLKPEEATGWHVVAEGIVNRVVSPAVEAFTLDLDPNKGGRNVDITLLANPDLSNRPAQTVKIELSSTGRNTSYGFPENVCSDTPT
ncbi:MAG: type II secretion system protein [Actinomycetota bacterium]